jgi:hypothetical protein
MRLEGSKISSLQLGIPDTYEGSVRRHATEVEGVSKNVSVGGLLVRSTLMIPQNTPISFILSVHGEQAVRPVHLMGEGDIVRAESEESHATFVLTVKCKAPIL